MKRLALLAVLAVVASMGAQSPPPVPSPSAGTYPVGQPVTVVAMPGGNWIDHSNTITLGGTAQTVAPARNRRAFWFQNISDTDMYLNNTGTASAASGSWYVKAGGGTIVWENSGITYGAISVFCATTGKAYTAKEL